jgi:hypothetical protein
VYNTIKTGYVGELKGSVGERDKGLRRTSITKNKKKKPITKNKKKKPRTKKRFLVN